MGVHRNVPPSQLKLVSGDTDNIPQDEYVVEAIVNHRGYPNCIAKYLTM